MLERVFSTLWNVILLSWMGYSQGISVESMIDSVWHALYPRFWPYQEIWIEEFSSDGVLYFEHHYRGKVDILVFKDVKSMRERIDSLELCKRSFVGRVFYRVAAVIREHFGRIGWCLFRKYFINVQMHYPILRLSLVGDRGDERVYEFRGGLVPMYDFRVAGRKIEMYPVLFCGRGVKVIVRWDEVCQRWKIVEIRE